MKIYLISGKAGSGKNEVAKYLKENLDNSVVTSLSKYIKLYAKELTDWDGNENNKPREFLQLLGDKLRAIDINFLTKRLEEDIEVYKIEGIKNVIVTDVRLVNEIEYFNKYDVTTIRVNSNINRRNLSDIEREHKTEIELDNYKNFNYIIDNNDNKLKEKIINIIGG